MKKLTRWRPDTCKCEIEYEWDTEDLEYRRLVSINPCARHADASHDISYDKAVKDNKGKNKLINKAAEMKGVEDPSSFKWKFNEIDGELELEDDVRLAEVDKQELKEFAKSLEIKVKVR